MLTSDELVHMLVDIVSKGGNLLLNVGPQADGTIPWAQTRCLLGLGWWLQTNGDALFGTRPWHIAEGTTADGTPVRFTRTDDSLYAIVLGTPRGNEVVIEGIRPPDGARVERLGYKTPLAWDTGPDGLRVSLAVSPAATPALALRITPFT
jgi:alpha-L-fucosidase